MNDSAAKAIVEEMLDDTVDASKEMESVRKSLSDR